MTKGKNFSIQFIQASQLTIILPIQVTGVLIHIYTGIEIVSEWQNCQIFQNNNTTHIHMQNSNHFWFFPLSKWRNVPTQPIKVDQFGGSRMTFYRHKQLQETKGVNTQAFEPKQASNFQAILKKGCNLTPYLYKTERC